MLDPVTSLSPIDTAFNPEPQQIGKGSFADVYVLVASRVAFKQVQYEPNTPQLLAEFEALEHLYATCNPDSFFRLPRPLAYSDPRDARTFRGTAPPESRPFQTGVTTRTRRPRPLVAPGEFAAFRRPAYAMDRVQALPTQVATRIREQFYPANAPDRGPSLFRLYFGKDYTNARQSRFINTSVFFLDVARYNQVASYPEGIADWLPDAQVVAEAMGNMLGRIHSRGGYDGRDIEFVLGGNGYSGFEFYVIDFNQIRKWNGAIEAVGELVDAYRTNDPYFPLARRGDPVYEEFRNGYRAAYRARLDIADAFLSQIEALQITKDSS
ncbi:hypothetical protein IW261DRAFT_1467262 [Armillaria novae-zelandiae]|uniref:DUF3669 domain-containing protein n=1 Tax=Armillaria novae-zelandiae TaxID=153914 RepID=A0AA39PDN1_9AGAR|nr:hypothetical protein IW261DRAFT_1467262 [Armillaria novae-zelandiae]